MRSGLSYLAEELPYKKWTEWAAIILNMFGILFASVNLLTGDWWLFLLLAGLNTCVLFSTLLMPFRYLKLHPLSVLNLIGSVSGYTQFKHKQALLIEQINDIHKALNIVSNVEPRSLNMLNIQQLTDIRDRGVQCIHRRMQINIDKSIAIHNQHVGVLADDNQ